MTNDRDLDEMHLRDLSELERERVVFVLRDEGVTYDAGRGVIRFPKASRTAVQAALDEYVGAELDAAERNTAPRWA